jgi:hypothetical protein
MDVGLHSRWITASYSIGRIGEDPFGAYLTVHIQSLGRLDCVLRDQDEEIAELFEDAGENQEPTWTLDDYIMLSRLWVLDGYEFLRTARNTIRAGLWAPPQAVTGDIARVEGLFKSIRVPLAKYEPAFRTGKAAPGDIVPEPVFVPGRGAGWDIGDRTPNVIARNDLADALLRSLERARGAHSAIPATK